MAAKQNWPSQVNLINLKFIFLFGLLFASKWNTIRGQNFNFNRVPYQTKAAVMVKRNSRIRSLTDLRGKRTCHSGYGTEAGWHIPIGIMARKLNLAAFDCRGEFHAMSSFFNASCAPGRWSTDLLVDRQLKKQHDKLCSLCRDPVNCSLKDDYYGEEGAVRCVVNGDGEVAFTTLDAINDFFKFNPRKNRDDYMILCLDGSSEPISTESCDWGVKPSNAFVIKKGRNDSCEECLFDFSGALRSINLMLIVLISVLTPMLLVIVIAFIIRFCCPNLLKCKQPTQYTIKPNLINA